MKQQNRKSISIMGVILLGATQLLSGCQNEEAAAGNTIKIPKSLNQAAFKSGTTQYQYGHNSIPNMFITGAPTDTDGNRWAMLHDGSTYRLYFFKAESDDTLYQFAYNPASSDYEYGYNSINKLTITNKPDDADASSISMLHDGTTYRLYMQSKTDPANIYQFGYKPGTNVYEYGYNSIPMISVTGMPIDTDYTRWGMLHDGSAYRYYAFKLGSDKTFYQAGFNGASYAYGHNSIPQLTVESMPTTSDTSGFAMLHDGSDYRFYFQTK